MISRTAGLGSTAQQFERLTRARGRPADGFALSEWLVLAGTAVQSPIDERLILVGSRRERERCKWLLSVDVARNPTFRLPPIAVLKYAFRYDAGRVSLLPTFAVPAPRTFQAGTIDKADAPL